MNGYLFDSWVHYLTISLSFTNIKISLICYMFCFILSEYNKICTIRRTWCIHAYEPIILELLNYLHVCCFNLGIFCNFTVFKKFNVFPPLLFVIFKTFVTFWYPLECCHILDIPELGSLVQNTQTVAFVLFVCVF